MKHPVKQATLFRSSYVEDGKIHFIPPEEVAYRKLMGRPSPEPFPEGTLAHDQWTYRKDSRKRAADELAHPKAKPAKKAPRPRRARHVQGIL